MAHFAKLNKENIVLEVHCVNNQVLNPIDEEQSGIAFLINWSGGHPYWRQTSYNGAFRKRFAGIGFRYDEIRDAFIPPQPFLSWIFNEQTLDWDPPIPYPTDGNVYSWDETNNQWKEDTQDSTIVE